MEKKRLFKIMANADRDSINTISASLKNKHNIIIIKEPTKTLTMIKMREPVQSSLFYIGEVIVTEAVVEFDGVKGMAVCMGDDFEKTLNMAIIDAAYNKGVFAMEERLLELEEQHRVKIEKENALHLKTMVNFNTMDSGVAQ